MLNKNIRTDMAIESLRLDPSRNPGIPEGILVDTTEGNEITITRIKITSATGENATGKPIGNYVTLDIPNLNESDQDLFENSCRALAKELEDLIILDENATVLVVGLGNWNVTPDSLGPKAISNLVITRHLHEHAPNQIKKGTRPVCAIAPGVLGITGIETSEIVKGIIDRIKPSLVIAIDALASRKSDRVCTSIQITDTGITPGSGVGNKRMELSQKTLGIPVIAVGVPTVIDAVTLTNDTMDLYIEKINLQNTNEQENVEILKTLHPDERYQLIKELLKPYIGNLIVTPKEIDEVVKKVAKVISNGINLALHKGIDGNDINRFIQ